MAPKPPTRILKTKFSNSEMRRIEALYVTYKKEGSTKTWKSWLQEYQDGLARKKPEERAMHDLFMALFDVQLRLERVESMLLSLIDQVPPTMTFAEVKKLFGADVSDKEIREWLYSHSIARDRMGRYRRAQFVKAYGNEPIGA